MLTPLVVLAAQTHFHRFRQHSFALRTSTQRSPHNDWLTMAPKGDSKEAVELTAESDKKKDTKKKIEDEPANAMSEEDQELKERLETCVSTVLNVDKEAAVTIGIRQNALDVIVNELRTATSSMTSVPKPLKFLRPHFADIQKLHETLILSVSPDNETLEFRARLADVLAVLAMTMGKHGKKVTL